MCQNDLLNNWWDLKLQLLQREICNIENKEWCYVACPMCNKGLTSVHPKWFYSKDDIIDEPLLRTKIAITLYNNYSYMCLAFWLSCRRFRIGLQLHCSFGDLSPVIIVLFICFWGRKTKRSCNVRANASN